MHVRVNLLDFIRAGVRHVLQTAGGQFEQFAASGSEFLKVSLRNGQEPRSSPGSSSRPGGKCSSPGTCKSPGHLQWGLQECEERQCLSIKRERIERTARLGFELKRSARYLCTREAGQKRVLV